MKRITLLAICLCAASALQAQKQAPKKVNSTAAHRAKNRTAIGGFILDNRRQPIPGVEAFVYRADSTIAASGYTDSMGHYETNAVLPGKYDMKIVYPSDVMASVTGVVVKKGITNISITMASPPQDTLILFYELQPKPVEKPKPATKKK